ncbi:MFS transporter [[Collinsella] massiliensis]|uniref:MFS transporter n=1 Tax=[Collinsella] massiliensis TaxID=1232426 RepID=A0A1Y3XNX0_9ACTN|nr:MFS transporter [[Collinsella] massiliensis]OUN87193.1 MFS transporter [[Collinsella] massiliensis]
MGAFGANCSARGAWKLKLACVWGGELISVLTSSVLQMGLIWHITLTTNSASMLSLASLAGFLPLALFGMVAGTIVDRFPLRRSLIGADLFIAAVSLVVAVAAAMGELPVWVVIAALFLRAIGSAFHTPAFQALTPLLAPPEYLTRLAGAAQAVQSGGYILGTALAAVIYPLSGLVPMVVPDVVGALFAAGAVLAAHIRAGGREPGSAGGSSAPGGDMRALFAETRDGYRVLRGYRGLFALLWCGFAFTLVFSPISALFPLMTLDHFGGTTADAALAEIVFSIGMIAGSALLTATGGFKNRALTVVAATALYGAATLVAGLLGAGGFAAFLAMSFLMGLSSPFYSGPQTALMQERVPPEFLGRVFGLYGAIMSWAMPLGLAASTLFADTVGAPAWFSGAGCAMLVLAVLTWCIPSIRHIEAEG